MKLEDQVCSLELARQLKELGGFEGIYEIDREGNIYSIPRKNGYGSRLVRKVRKPKLVRGYLQIALSKNGNNIWRPVHRLVAEAFIPNPRICNQVNHINGNKTDNRVENLEWCTQSENQTHAVRTGLRKSERTNTAKLTADQVREIRSLYPTLNSRELADKFGIKQAQVCKIIKRQSWRQI